MSPLPISNILLKHLFVRGPGKVDAILSFQEGLNVICGNSDTGKTYVFQALDYAFGAGSAPKEIPEASGYLQVGIEFRIQEKTYTLLRSIYDTNEPALLYSATHNDLSGKTPDELQSKHVHYAESISSFFLNHLGFDQYKVKVNANNKTNNLSLRILSEMFIKSEIRIIEEASPVFNEINTDTTKQQSAFKLLISGVDDSDLKLIEPKEVKEGKRNAQVELYDGLIAKLQRSIERIHSQLEGENMNWDQLLADITAELDATTDSIKRLIDSRVSISRRLNESKNRLEGVNTLITRFNHLESVYKSDQQRLEFMLTGSHYLDQLEVLRCPTCGRPIWQHGQANHDVPDELVSLDFVRFQAAWRAEQTKIEAQLTDLRNTVQNLRSEGALLLEQVENWTTAINGITKQINSELEPAYTRYQNQYEHISQQQKLKIKLESNQAQMEDYIDQKLKLESLQFVKETANSLVEYPGDTLESFCGEVRETLTAWNYTIDTINFDRRAKVADLILDNKARSSYGKGSRGVTCAAFLISVMRHCQTSQLPHPRLVILDSPLVNYDETHGQNKRGVTEADLTPESTVVAFYTDLATNYNYGQIIILENESPPPELQETANFVEFTGERDFGRYGFFPVQSGDDVQT